MFSDVKDDISAILRPYGLMSIYEATDQQSNSVMVQELEGIAAVSTSMPVMFLLIAGAIVYIMLKRLVELQRGQIGLLKAFGFSDMQILTHYIAYVSVMGVSGALLGSLSGTLLSGVLMVTPNIAESINASKGDYIYISSPLARYPEEETRIMISDIQEQLMGSNGYMSLYDLAEITGYPGRANKIIISADEQVQLSIKEKYTESPYVGGITISDSFIAMLEDMMGLVTAEILYLGVIAVVTGFAIIYNSMITVISEREREMTSMMVLGMSEKEVFDIVSFEQWVLSIAGMLLGAPVTKLLLVLMMSSLDTDMYYLPADFDIRFYLMAIMVTVIAVTVGQMAAFRKITKLNLADALKSNE